MRGYRRIRNHSMEVKGMKSKISKVEFKYIYNITRDIQRGLPVQDREFDAACKILDKVPDLTLSEMYTIAKFYDLDSESTLQPNDFYAIMNKRSQ